MSWRFRKSFGFGPFRSTISKSGIGKSIGFFGFRFGVTPDGRKYWSFGIRGTGLYYIKYLS
jgi:hypothetical protein